MTQTRDISTKALSAFFVGRRSSLAVALAQVGITDRAYLDGETISIDIVGKIARRFGYTPEKLTALVAEYETA